MKRWTRAVPWMLLVVATLLVYRLADQNDELVQRLTNLREATRKPLPGYAVPTFTAITLDGDTVTVGEAAPGRRQLLFVFTTTCPYCQATLPAWTHVASRIREDRTLEGEVMVLGISKDSLPATLAYRREHDLEFPILQLLPGQHAPFLASESVIMSELPQDRPIAPLTDAIFVRVPAEHMIDTFAEIFNRLTTAQAICPRELNERFDQLAYVFDRDIPDKHLRSQQRKVVGTAPGGWSILLDTNASTVDFYTAPRSPGELPAP